MNISTGSAHFLPCQKWTPSLWLDTFIELLYNELDYGDRWTLTFNYSKTETVTEEERRRGWKVFIHSTFGSFQCASCKKTWASARVTLLFRYRLLRGKGTVIVCPFGQACRRCRGYKFNLPGLDEKKVKHALHRQFFKIRKNCYREEHKKDNERSPSETEVRRTKPHETSLCQACHMGLCGQDEKDDD